MLLYGSAYSFTNVEGIVRSHVNSLACLMCIKLVDEQQWLGMKIKKDAWRRIGQKDRCSNSAVRKRTSRVNDLHDEPRRRRPTLLLCAYTVKAMPLLALLKHSDARVRRGTRMAAEGALSDSRGTI